MSSAGEKLDLPLNRQGDLQVSMKDPRFVVNYRCRGELRLLLDSRQQTPSAKLKSKLYLIILELQGSQSGCVFHLVYPADPDKPDEVYMQSNRR